MFGYKPTIYMPKDHYKRLQTQCSNMEIPILLPSTSSSDTESTLSSALSSSDVILDAIFGFSFKGPVRAPFDAALKLVVGSGLPIVSVDIPSGWDVETGREGLDLGEGVPALDPDVLISLTAPKEGVKAFRGRHFLGGRFVPRSMAEKHELNLPDYPGYEQIVELPQARL
jgi:NAD(P)H-hydrate epimerase